MRGDNQHHHQGRPSGSNAHRPVIRGGIANASLHSRGFGRAVRGHMHQPPINQLLPASYRPEITGHQQASGSMTDGRVGPQGEEPQRGRVEAQRGRGGNGRGRGRGRDGTPDLRKLGYKTLEGLLEKEASEVAITLSFSTGLKNLLDDDMMRSDLVLLVCQVLCKAFESRIDRKIVLHLVGIVKDSTFFRNGLPYHVTAMMSDYAQGRKELYPQHLNNIISLLSEVLNMFPHSSIQSVSMLVALLKPTVNQLRASGVDVLDNTDGDLERVQGLVDHLQEKSREGTLRSDNYSFLAADEDAPPGEEDFRTMSIYPTIEEFHLDLKPFLRPNIMTQRFPNARIYLEHTLPASAWRFREAAERGGQGDPEDPAEWDCRWKTNEKEAIWWHQSILWHPIDFSTLHINRNRLQSAVWPKASSGNPLFQVVQEHSMYSIDPKHVLLLGVHDIGFLLICHFGR